MGRYGDWDESWDRAIEATDRVGKAFDYVVYDYETGKSWDPGQAICREMFGPGWSNDDKFHEMSSAEVCSNEYFKAADRLCARTPDWIKDKDE